MRKISVVFVLDRESGVLLPNVREGNEWVIAGEGIATLKFDGSATLFRGGRLWKRFDRKLNKKAQRLFEQGKLPTGVDESFYRVAPDGFEPCEALPDPITHHWPGWVPVSRDNPADKYHLEALGRISQPLKEGQTYELVGPTLGCNPYELSHHELREHGETVIDLPDRSYEGLRNFLENNYIEGVVFHHPDGRMAKLRRKDFQLFWVKEDTRR